MLKKFFQGLAFCGEGLREILPQPISLYTHRSDWGHRSAFVCCPETVPGTASHILLFLLLFLLCLLAVCGGVVQIGSRFNTSDNAYLGVS